MSLRIVPAKADPSRTTPVLSAPSAPGLHDTLRASLTPQTAASAAGQKLGTGSSLSSYSNPTSTGTSLVSSHPLESRLAGWRATQDALRMNMLRRTYGIAEPVRREMEMKIIREGEWRPACLGGSSPGVACIGTGTGGVHSDILAGRDMDIGWEDVFGAGAEFRERPSFHAEMEARFKMA